MSQEGTNTVAGRNPAPADMVNTPLFTGFRFYTSQWCRISSINSMVTIGPSFFFRLHAKALILCKAGVVFGCIQQGSSRQYMWQNVCMYRYNTSKNMVSNLALNASAGDLWKPPMSLSTHFFFEQKNSLPLVLRYYFGSHTCDFFFEKKSKKISN